MTKHRRWQLHGAKTGAGEGAPLRGAPLPGALLLVIEPWFVLGGSSMPGWWLRCSFPRMTY